MLDSNDHLLQGIIRDTSLKMTVHFTNWAKPNPDFYTDEFVALVTCFPIIDLSWRLGKGTPTKDTFDRLYRLLAPGTPDACWQILAEKQFQSRKRPLTMELIQSRLDEYAATYLLDRQADEWTYQHTCAQASRNCIAASASEDRAGFESLVSDVLDRARGRVKKGLEKAICKVQWRSTPDGWQKEIRHFD